MTPEDMLLSPPPVQATKRKPDSPRSISVQGNPRSAPRVLRTKVQEITRQNGPIWTAEENASLAKPMTFPLSGKPVRYPLEAGVSAEPLEVTRMRKCQAHKGASHCNAEFLQTAWNASGSFQDAKEHPTLVRWLPEFCLRCERALLRANAVNL